MNVAALIRGISLLSSAIPIIAGLVTQVETLMSGVPGLEKFRVVEAAAEAYFRKAVADVDVLAHILPKIGGIINALVAVFNASGVFPKAAVGVNRVASELSSLGSALGN